MKDKLLQEQEKSHKKYVADLRARFKEKKSDLKLQL